MDRFAGGDAGYIAAMNAFDRGVTNRRNLARNGDFRIISRGSSVLPVVGLAYTLDGWKNSGTVNTTFSQQTFAVGQTDVPGNPINYMRMVRTVAAGAADAIVTHPIEFPQLLGGLTVTWSVWARISAGTKTVKADFTSSGVTSAIDTNDKSIALTTVWTKFTDTVAIPAMTAATASAFLLWRLIEDAGFSTFTIELADFQVEVGSVASDFERLPLLQQQLWNRRFLPRWAGAANTLAHGTARSTTQAYIILPLTPETRALVTGITVSLGTHFQLSDGVTATATTSVAFGAATLHSIILDVGVAAGLTQFRPYLFVFNNAAANLYGTGAEL